jgi:inner membrane protein
MEDVMTNPMTPTAPRAERSPGMKLLFTILIGLALTIPLLSVYLLVYDRNQQSTAARASIVEGWGGEQTLAGPMLAIPYQHPETTEVDEGGKKVKKTENVWTELVLAPERMTLDTAISPQHRHRSIYDAIVYEVAATGEAKFSLPVDLARQGIAPESLQFERAELRFGLSDPRGLFGTPPHINAGGKALQLQPGHGPKDTQNAGFFAWVDASALRAGALVTSFDYNFRGNGALAFKPRAGDTDWKVHSSWASPSFKGGFLPSTSVVNDKGFTAEYRIGNLALGQSLIGESDGPVYGGHEFGTAGGVRAGAEIQLIQPVDVYDQVNRATKYGFLFVGFTFLVFLMFDLIGGVKISPVEYLLVGVALILFFVLLLAFAEVIGFLLAYLGASAAIIGLIAAYSSAVLKSRHRAMLVGGLLVGLYAVLYVLLSLEAYALLIGGLLLFIALAGVMYVTRKIDWSSPAGPVPGGAAGAIG